MGFTLRPNAFKTKHDLRKRRRLVCVVFYKLKTSTDARALTHGLCA